MCTRTGIIMNTDMIVTTDTTMSTGIIINNGTIILQQRLKARWGMKNPSMGKIITIVMFAA